MRLSARTYFTMFFAAWISMGDACDDDTTPTQGPPPLCQGTTIAPAEVRQGVGGTSVLAIKVCIGGETGGATGRPFPLQITAEDNGVLEKVGPTNVRMTTPGELTYTAGPPPAWNSFVSANVDSTFELRVTCAKIGKAKITVNEVGVALDSTATVECTGDPPTGTERRPPREFANGVGEMTTVDRSGAAFAFQKGGVASNFGERTPSMWGTFSDIGQYCEQFVGLTDFKSVKGVDSLTAAAGAQTGTATYNASGEKYVWSGLVAGPVFGVEGKVDYTFGTTTIPVVAPADYTTPEETLSAPAGADTKFSFPEADTETSIAIYGSMETGAGFSCLFPNNILSIENGKRWAYVVPEDVRTAVTDYDSRLNSIFIGKVRGAPAMGLFPGVTRDLQAARLLRVSYAKTKP